MKRRRLLCPKYLSQWISYLSLKIIKHREYSKVLLIPKILTIKIFIFFPIVNQESNTNKGVGKLSFKYPKKIKK